MSIEVRGITPFVACRDLAESLRFYTETLGFEEDWTWGEPASDAGVRNGAFSLYLMSNAELATRAAGSEIVIGVADLQSAFEYHSTRGADIVSGIEAKPWGSTEYSVRDPNGYILRFGE